MSIVPTLCNELSRIHFTLINIRGGILKIMSEIEFCQLAKTQVNSYELLLHNENQCVKTEIILKEEIEGT